MNTSYPLTGSFCRIYVIILTLQVKAIWQAEATDIVRLQIRIYKEQLKRNHAETYSKVKRNGYKLV